MHVVRMNAMKITPLLLLLLLAGCVDPRTRPEARNKDTAALQPVDTAVQQPADTTRNMSVNTPSPTGIYQVLLPLAGGRRREHTIAFAPDLAYRLEEREWKPGSPSQKREGRWRPNNGIIEVYDGTQLFARYTWKNDTLVYLGTKGNFPMQKLRSATDNKVWADKKSAGTDFFGTGTEPFWNIEIDDGQSISFHLAEWSGPKRFPASVPVQSGDSIVYTTQTDSASVRVTVYRAFCNDGMSDFVYPNSVRVQYNKQVFRGCGVLYR